MLPMAGGPLMKGHANFSRPSEWYGKAGVVFDRAAATITAPSQGYFFLFTSLRPIQLLVSGKTNAAAGTLLTLLDGNTSNAGTATVDSSGRFSGIADLRGLGSAAFLGIVSSQGPIIFSQIRVVAA